MKKILLGCFLALGIGANAQYNVLENFEGAADGRIFFGNGAANTTVFCSGTTSWAANVSSATGNTQVGYAVSFADKTVPQTTTGQSVSISVNYRKTAGAGTLYLAYFVFDPVLNQWSVNTFATRALTATAVTTCTPLTGTIPAGVLDQASLAPGAKYAIGTFFVRGSGTGILYIDDLSVVEDVVVTPPACTTFTTPTNGAVVPAGSYAISWAAAPTATKYQLNVGTTPGGTDVFSGLVSGTSTTVSLAVSSNYYATVTPLNANGSATGCSEIAFSSDAVIAYCTPTPNYTTIEPITNVTFAGINNTTSALVGGTPSYENFTTIIGTANRESTYPISLNANTDGAFSHYFAVYIDWNQDGDFNDAEEKYFTTSAGLIFVNSNNGSGTPATGSITVPATAKLGNTRMRVKSAYYTATGILAEPAFTNFGNPCVTTGSTFGQVEDYTINVDVSLATVDTSKNTVALYPNPFTDVLKISDVKGVKSISISDVSGRLVKTVKASAEIQVSELKTGLYIVNLHMEDGSVKSIKAIKK